MYALAHSTRSGTLHAQAPAATAGPSVPFEGTTESASQFGEKAIQKRAAPAAQQMPEHLPFEGEPHVCIISHAFLRA